MSAVPSVGLWSLREPNFKIQQDKKCVFLDRKNAGSSLKILINCSNLKPSLRWCRYTVLLLRLSIVSLLEAPCSLHPTTHQRLHSGEELLWPAFLSTDDGQNKQEILQWDTLQMPKHYSSFLIPCCQHFSPSKLFHCSHRENKHRSRTTRYEFLRYPQSAHALRKSSGIINASVIPPSPLPVFSDEHIKRHLWYSQGVKIKAPSLSTACLATTHFPRQLEEGRV